MSILEVTSLSTRGQVVIPNDIRENMNLKPGTKMIIIQEGDNILLKPIKAPRMSQFDKIIALGDKARIELNLKESDVDQAIKNVRKNKNAHSSRYKYNNIGNFLWRKTERPVTEMFFRNTADGLQ